MRLKNRNELSPIGLIIKKRLVELNMRQRDLAIKIGANERYIYLMLYGFRTGEKYIQNIEKVLDIDLQTYKKSA